MKAHNRMAYFGVSTSNRNHFDKEIESIRRCLKPYHINLEVFVDKYNFTSEQENEMMRIAFDEIKKCDLLIAEVSKKAIGVGVEVGFAKALKKPIIYIRKMNSSYSTTVGGAADYQLVYANEIQLKKELDCIIPLIFVN